MGEGEEGQDSKAEGGSTGEEVHGRGAGGAICVAGAGEGMGESRGRVGLWLRVGGECLRQRNREST